MVSASGVVTLSQDHVGVASAGSMISHLISFIVGHSSTSVATTFAEPLHYAPITATVVSNALSPHL
jgi:hypothetical protein